MRTHLTMDVISGLTPDPKRDRLIFDTEIPGFALKLTPPGSRIMILQYWSPVEVGKKRRLTIGTLGEYVLQPGGRVVPLTLALARRMALTYRGQIHERRDPLVERRERVRVQRVEELARRKREAGARSVLVVADQFLRDARDRGLREATVREWERLLQRHVLPVIGSRPVAELVREDVLAVKRAVPRGRHVLANRVQQVCRALVNFAGSPDDARPNPFTTGARGQHRWYREELTRTPLSREELGRLFAALDALDARPGADRGGSVDAIRLLALTGWRKSEVLRLRWDAIDFGVGLARLSATKTGRSERALSPTALALLERIPQRGPYVFPSPTLPGRPVAEIKRTWLRVRAAAGIQKPLHALRHTAATLALSEGVPLATVGALLGHSDPKTTLRYARTEHAAALEAARTLDRAISATTATADVRPIASGTRRAR